ncbi:hypothetical protein TSUD_300160 [Trifolium subterraneum]|uniref:Uncharacterized protein n=1 Tax=Trifolium subterraneum TaxID=3900 RepID=A0A2Z6NJY3_TRISU|nr:hypothetical protein TSUD_300160 [Trifolium subterraneum]
MLENQLPMFVLTKLFELTDKTNSPPTQMSFYNLVFKFFYQLVQSESRKTIEFQTGYKFKIEHALDLLRYNIRPKLLGEQHRGCQSQVIHSITELKEGGVKINACENRELLDISFGGKWRNMIKQLTIPPLFTGVHTEPEYAKFSSVIRGLIIIPFRHPPHSTESNDASKEPDHGPN